MYSSSSAAMHDWNISFRSDTQEINSVSFQGSDYLQSFASIDESHHGIDVFPSDSISPTEGHINVDSPNRPLPDEFAVLSDLQAIQTNQAMGSVCGTGLTTCDLINRLNGDVTEPTTDQTVDGVTNSTDNQFGSGTTCFTDEDVETILGYVQEEQLKSQSQGTGELTTGLYGDLMTEVADFTTLDDEEDVFDFEPTPHGYDLRPGFRDATIRQTTWLDQDETGDYDPHAKPSRKHAGKRREPHAASETAETRRLWNRQTRLEQAAARYNGDSYCFTFDVFSGKGKAIVEKIADNWPTVDWNVHDDTRLHNVDASNSCDDGDDTLKQLGCKYRLRARTADQTGEKFDRPNLQGRPAARGCWSCYDLGMLDDAEIAHGRQCCSLVYDGSTWPCIACAADDQECELITVPKMKNTCERCRRRKVNCSYTRDSDHTGPCKECQIAGDHCVAGPSKAATHQRISLDRLIGQQDHGADCSDCAKAGRLCSEKQPEQSDELRGNDREEAGAECVETGEPMATENPSNAADKKAPHKRKPVDKHTSGRGKKQKAPRRQRASKGRQDIFVDSDTDTDEAGPGKDFCSGNSGIAEHGVFASQSLENTTHHEPPQETEHEQGSRPEHVPAQRIILTKLCRPIIFNHEITLPTEQCHFCSVASYAVLGLGNRKTTIIDHPETGTTEIQDDSSGTHPEKTRICTVCTHELMKKLVCRPHAMQPLDEAPNFDFNGLFTRLVEGKTLPTDHWCSVCPSPAEYTCRRDITHESTRDQTNGCGLLLCANCHAQAQTSHAGDTSQFLHSLPVGATASRPFGLRADAELLKPWGDLRRFMMRL